MGMDKILKEGINILIGTVFGGGVVAVIGQKQKNRLREEAKRAQRTAERAVKAGEILQEECNKRKWQECTI